MNSLTMALTHQLNYLYYLVSCNFNVLIIIVNGSDMAWDELFTESVNNIISLIEMIVTSHLKWLLLCITYVFYNNLQDTRIILNIW